MNKQKNKFIANFENLVDLVLDDDNNIVFLIKNNNKLEMIRSVEIGGEVYLPPLEKHLPNELNIAKGENVIKNYNNQINFQYKEANKIIYNNVKKYIAELSELPEAFYYGFLSVWMMHTYLIEHFHYSPMIIFYANAERGKSRTGKAIVYGSYRGLRLESTRIAPLIRLATNLKPTLFMDIMDAWGKTKSNEAEDIILARYERGMSVPRVNRPDAGAFEDMDMFQSFGPTIIASNEPLNNILDTRGININMPLSRKRFNNIVTPDLAIEVKENLLALRARYLGVELPRYNKLVNGRLGDITAPLFQIASIIGGKDAKICIKKVIEKTQKDKIADRTLSLEAEILQVVVSSTSSIVKGVLPLSKIVDTLNINRKYPFSYKRISNILRSMSFQTTKVGNGSTAIIWSEELIKALCEMYGVLFPSERSESLEYSKEGIYDDSKN